MITLYFFSEYIFLPKVIHPISVKLNSKWIQYLLRIKISSSTSSFKEDGIPYQSHTRNKFTSSFYTFTVMTPITSHLSDETATPAIDKSIAFTSSPGLVSKYLDDCEADRCTSATPILERECLEQLKPLSNCSKIVSGSTPFMSSPSMVDKFLDECEADRECNSQFEMVSQVQDSESPCICLTAATAKRPKPLPQRVILLRGQRI